MTFYLGAYWGPRRESVQQCACRFSRCLNAIRYHSPMLADWYHERDGVRSPSTRRENWVLILPHEPALTQLLRKGVNRGTGTEEPSRQLGFHTGFWNLRHDEEGGASVSTRCGSYSEYAPPNSFLLSLPEPECAPELYERHTARALMETVIECWHPDWATWTSHSLRDLQDQHVTGQSLDWTSLKPGDALPQGVEKPLGWATYFSTLTDPPADLPPGAELHKVGTERLLTIGEDPAHVPAELVLAMRDLLGEKALA